MVVRAVVFDVGGVLERVEDADRWLCWCRDRLGLSDDEFRAAYARIDPHGQIGLGGVTEAEYWQEWTAAFALTTSQVDEIAAAFCDWYCGELDEELMAYAAGLRSTCRVAILSNSAAGAREQEEAHYAFAATFDPIIYSHEVGLAKPDAGIYALTCERLGTTADQTVFLDDTQACVDEANAYGMHGLLHRDTVSSIAAIEALRAQGDRRDAVTAVRSRESGAWRPEPPGPARAAAPPRRGRDGRARPWPPPSSTQVGRRRVLDRRRRAVDRHGPSFPS